MWASVLKDPAEVCRPGWLLKSQAFFHCGFWKGSRAGVWLQPFPLGAPQGWVCPARPWLRGAEGGLLPACERHAGCVVVAGNTGLWEQH